MSDVRAMFDDLHIKAWDLKNKDQVVTITRVEAGKIKDQVGKESRKPIIYVNGISKGLVLNKTNMRTVAAMYGYDTAGWVGKRIVLYPTQTEMSGATVDCIRVRPRPPGNAMQKAPRGAAPTPDITDDGEIRDDAQEPSEPAQEAWRAAQQMTDEQRAAAIDAGLE